MISILDCYTDEPAGLGVPPFLGVYPRYIFGEAAARGEKCYYLRIDDLRTGKQNPHKTDILTLNRTKNAGNANSILKNSDQIIVIAGIQTPGRYLSAIPGSCKEAARLLAPFKANKVLAGPSAGLGATQIGGKIAHTETQLFDGVYKIPSDYSKLKAGAQILDQLESPIMIELETGRGCSRSPGCSFCTEPLKSRLEWRNAQAIIHEVKALMKNGAKHFRLGKQSDLYSYKDLKPLLEGISALKPKTLHIDNVDPAVAAIREDITKLIVKHCTSGNVAPLGVESFDPKVLAANNINSSPDQVLRAIRLINKHGGKRGDNGLPLFLPGINLLLGLIGETKTTLRLNLKWLLKILESGMLLRRINIRQVDVFSGTPLANAGGLKYLKKNKAHYFSFRKKVRENVDHEMLKKLVPAGTLLKDVFMELHDGNTSFGRQMGSYPLIVGIKKKLELRKFYSIKVTGHMLRSITGEPMQRDHQGAEAFPESKQKPSGQSSGSPTGH